MKQLKTTQIVLWMLLSVPFVSLKAQQSLWVGEEYQCFLTDYANTSLSILNVSWTVPSEMKEEFSGTYVRTVSFSQYQSGTYSVRASWKETDMSDSFSPFYSRSHTWSFTCRDNPLVLNNSSLTLTKGSTGTIGYSHTYSNEYTSLAKVTYSSSNTSVASVSSTGVVTAKGAGTATITVTSTIAKDPKTCTVTVKSTPSGIQFADAKVKALCVANWDTDGDGELSEAEAAAVTDLGTIFKNNTTITSFNELQYFTGLTSIDFGAFDGCTSLTSVIIPSSVTSIDDMAFRDCGLTSIEVESGNTNYDSRNNCNAIIETASNTLIAGSKNTVIPESVTSIGHYAFHGRSGLTSIAIPKSVTSIGIDAFYGCSGLTSITIPESVTSIGVGVFAYCSGLTSITIPKSVVTITGNRQMNPNMFYRCSSLTSITVESGNTKYDSRDNCNAIIETASNTLVDGCTNTFVPESVTNIEYDALDGTAWYDNQPDGLVYAGKVAYKYKGTMPRGTEITINPGTLGIADYIFCYCSGLTSVIIPSSVTNIGHEAFSYCNGLTDVYCYAESVPQDDGWIFDHSPIASATLHVPAGSVEAYSTTYPWKNFGTIVAINYVTLGDLNGDGKVSITDIVMIVDVIAGDITDANQVAAADVNGDGKVSITDCSAAVDLIAAGTSTPSSARKKANAMLSNTDFISGTLHDGLLSIDLEAEHRFTAFQMTVSVPEGMTLGNGSMNAQRGADHLLTVRNLGGGRYLVAGFSADNEELTAGSGCLLTLVTEGQADADIVISDIEFATTQAEAYYLADAAVSSTPTGINEMKNEELRVKNEIYDLQGRRVTKATKGIYIYNGKKTMIK